MNDQTGLGELSRSIDDWGNRAVDQVKALEGKIGEHRGALDKVSGDLGSRLAEIEQKMVRRQSSGGAPERKTWGQALVDSDELKALVGTASRRGQARAQLNQGDLERKTVNTLITSGQPGLVAPQIETTPIMLPRRPLTIRQLLSPGVTTSNTIYYVKQTARQLNAATVAEGALKPQSDLTFAQLQAPVQTIAHTMKVSRQLLDDAAALRSTIDAEMEYGVNFVEDTQLLFGDGTGTNLFGLIPQATAYSAPFSITGETAIDRLGSAMAQAETSLYPATGIVLHPLDWRQMVMTKDGVGRYILGEPAGMPARQLWDTPIATSLAMPQGHFMVGAFGLAAQIYDRMEMEILASTEDQDNFVKNLVTIRGEKRLALAVKIPAAIIYGALPS